PNLRHYLLPLFSQFSILSSLCFYSSYFPGNKSLTSKNRGTHLHNEAAAVQIVLETANQLHSDDLGAVPFSSSRPPLIPSRRRSFSPADLSIRYRSSPMAASSCRFVVSSSCLLLNQPLHPFFPAVTAIDLAIDLHSTSQICKGKVRRHFFPYQACSI
ncbi:hypothetical protein LINPERPRIM_LOCUS11230, partial [Linum perenne]